jgi:hypothetical protein
VKKVEVDIGMTCDRAELLARVTPFFDRLPDLQKRQYEAIVASARHFFSSGDVIPNNAAISILLGRGTLGEKIDRLEASHLQVNALDTRLAETTVGWLQAKMSTNRSLAIQQLTGIGQQWLRHANLGNHFLGPRFASIIYRGLDELGIEHGALVECAARSADDIEDEVLSVLKVCLRVTPAALPSVLISIADTLDTALSGVDRIEVEKTDPNGRNKEGLRVSIFFAPGLMEPIDLAQRLSTVADGLLPVHGRYSVLIAETVALSQGYTGLKDFLSLGSALSNFYAPSLNFAIRLDLAAVFENSFSAKVCVAPLQY